MTAPKLHPREHDVCNLLLLGLDNKTIAHRLGITASTVSVHLSAVGCKLGCANRTAVALYLLRVYTVVGLENALREPDPDCCIDAVKKVAKELCRN